MEYRPLGRTDVQVSELCLGTARVNRAQIARFCGELGCTVGLAEDTRWHPLSWHPS
jgi:aryl-alcohol dehydrogenase-like predicted oxidoreductase